MRECFFILFFWQVFFCAIGQNTRIPYVQKKDSQEPVRFLSVASLDSQVQVKIKTESFDSIKSLIPTSKDLQVIFDSLSIEQSSIMIQMKFTYLQQNLKKQHKRLIEQAELSRFNLKNTQFVDRELDCGAHEMGFKFCYVIHTLESTSKTAIFSYLAIKLGDNWFLGDELRLGRPKRKKRKKKKERLKIPKQFGQ